MRDLNLFENPACSHSILHLASGKMLETLVLPASLAELKNLPGNWLFDWAKEAARYPVFKLVTVETPATIQGLVSLEERQGFYQLLLVESAPFNRGRRKEHEGVAGNLFAFACKLSMEKGYDGVVGFEAKSELIAHYHKTLGAYSIGHSKRMFIDEAQAEKLIDLYFPK